MPETSTPAASTVKAKAKATNPRKAKAKAGTTPIPVASPSSSSYVEAAMLLKLVSDPTRLRILVTLLREGTKNVGELCEIAGQSQPAVSHHICLGRHGGLLVPERRAKNTYYSLTEKGRVLAKLVSRFVGE